MAYFGDACTNCPLRAKCTTASGGRTIGISPYDQALARARMHQAEQAWRDDYRATRPKVERKLAHIVYRKHGGRRARMRGSGKVDAYFRLLAGAGNLARLGLGWTAAGWAIEWSADQREQTPAAAQPHLASGLASDGPPAGIRHTSRDDSHTINNNPSIHTGHLGPSQTTLGDQAPTFCQLPERAARAIASSTSAVDFASATLAPT